MATTAVRGQKLADELARMADRLEGKFRNAFLRSMISLSNDPELKKLLKDIQAGRFTYGDPIDARLNAVRMNLAEMNEVARQAIANSAKVTKDVLNLKGSFDVVNDAVIDAAKNLSVELSTYLRKSTKESLRQVIEDLIGGDISESEAIRRIKLEVGLLPQHTAAVSKYRKTLISTGTPRGRANQLAEQYAKRLLKYRANMIARTEVARATGIGQTQFWRQMRDQGALPPSANRVWITAVDERACGFCLSMNGQVATIDGGWETSNGYMEYPQASHPHCRCSSGITERRPTKTGQLGRVAKIDEIEWDRWVAKHLGGQHDQKAHAGGNRTSEPIARMNSGTESLAKSGFSVEIVNRNNVSEVEREHTKQWKQTMEHYDSIGENPPSRLEDAHFMFGSVYEADVARGNTQDVHGISTSQDASFVVRDSAGLIAGGLYIKRRADTRDARKKVFVVDTIVSMGLVDGCGAAMLSAAIKHAHSNGGKVLILHSVPSSKSYWSQMGFSESKKQAYSKLTTMELEITPEMIAGLS